MSTMYEYGQGLVAFEMMITYDMRSSLSTRCPKKIVRFLFFFLGAQCVESGVSCAVCY